LPVTYLTSKGGGGWEPGKPVSGDSTFGSDASSWAISGLVSSERPRF